MKKHLKDYFIPHEGNEYKPHSLQKAAVYGMATLVVLSFALANLQSLFWISSDWMVSTILPSIIVELTNEEREDNSLTNLRRNITLDAAAQLKAQHMADNQYFAHYSPAGISPWHWFAEADYNFVHAGENLAIHFTDSDEVVEAWMNSPTHRANIVNDNFTEIGVGAAQGTFDGFQTVYVVQLFGTPAAIASEPIAIEPAPQEPEPIVLAETEAVVEPEPEPEPAETSPVIAGSEDVITEVDDTEVSLSSERDPVEVVPSSTEDTVIAQTEIAEVVTTEESVALYSDHISTSTGGVPATIAPDAPSGQNEAGIIGIATKPQTVLQILYSIIALFVVGALILAVVIEYRRQHPIQVAYSAGLMATMALLLYIHVAVTSGALIV